MMWTKQLAIAMVLGIYVTFTGCSMGPDMKEGEWEITSEMGMEGVPMKMPALSHTQCITKDHLIPQESQDADRKCVLSHKEINGNTVSWKQVCSDGTAETASNGTVTYDGVHFTGKIDITISGGPMAITATSTITGKYLGPCQ